MQPKTKQPEVVWKPDALPDEPDKWGKQSEFLASTEDWCGIDGGKGSGKSDLLVIDCIRPEKLTSPRWYGVIFRREYKRLLEIIDRATYYFNQFPQFKAHWQGDQSRFMFPSGAWLAFHNCENIGDEQKYQGWQICDLKFDQIEEFDMKQLDFLFLQNRSADPRIRATIRWTANPLGVSHAQIKKRFIDNYESGKTYTFVEEVRGVKYPYTYKRIFATVFDNPYFRRYPEYIARLAAHPDPVWRKAMLEGDWNVVLGQFFVEYASHVHCISSDSVDLLKDWRRLAGCDYGNIKSIEFLCRDYRNNVYCEWEYHSEPDQFRPHGETASQFGANSARFMLDRGIGEGLVIVGDQNMWARTALDLGSQLTSAMLVQAQWNQAFQKEAKEPPILVKPTKRGTEEYNWRIACNEAIRNGLQYEMDTEGKLIKHPSIYFLDRCNSITITLPLLKASARDKQDFEHDGDEDDHDFDAFKMAYMMIQQSRKPKEELTAAQKFALGLREDVPEKSAQAMLKDWRIDF